MGDGCPRVSCHWVEARLPLLAGGELAGSDRRMVERHLIVCPSCRSHAKGQDQALNVLHMAASGTASDTGSSLWAGLQRQIREERHAPQSLADRLGLRDGLEALTGWLHFGFGLPLRPAVSPSFLGALFLILSLAGGVELWTQSRLAAVAGRDQAPGVLPEPSGPRSAPLEPRPSLPLPDRTPEGIADNTSRPQRFDLDSGTPMGPDSPGRDSTAAY